MKGEKRFWCVVSAGLVAFGAFQLMRQWWDNKEEAEEVRVLPMAPTDTMGAGTMQMAVRGIIKDGHELTTIDAK